MALSSKAKQMKLAKKTAKRKVQLKEKNTHIFISPQQKKEHKIVCAVKAPIYECWIPANLFEIGLGQLVFSRILSPNRIGFGIFLLDVWALGVKDCDYIELSLLEYQEQMKAMTQHLGEYQEVRPEYFKKLLLDAETFAKSHQFQSHLDYALVRKILSDVDASTCQQSFEFGKEGKPLIVEHARPHPCADHNCTVDH